MSYASWRGRGPMVVRSLNPGDLRRACDERGTACGVCGLGADELPDESDGVILRRVDANVLTLVQDLAADAERRKITVVLSVIGAIFAAVKLGIVALPHFEKWRDKE